MRLIRLFDVNIGNLITSWSPGLKNFFLLITMLGDPIVVVTIGAAIAAYGYLQADIWLFFSGPLVWLILVVGEILKLQFRRTRPISNFAQIIRLKTYSLPSGHATGSTAAYGLLAYIAWLTLAQPWNLVVASLLSVTIILIGVSRVYLKAHYVSDVLAGWTLGLAGLLVISIFIIPLA